MADPAKTIPTTDPTEPQLAKKETELATNPIGSEEGSESKEASTTEGKPGVTEIASNALEGVKDSVFSMFGGGAKKEKKVVEEDEEAKNEPSGSSKAQKKDDDAEEKKDADAEEKKDADHADAEEV